MNRVSPARAMVSTSDLTDHRRTWSFEYPLSGRETCRKHQDTGITACELPLPSNITLVSISGAERATSSF